jgi:hypothetical protein
MADRLGDFEGEAFNISGGGGFHYPIPVLPPMGNSVGEPWVSLQVAASASKKATKARPQAAAAVASVSPTAAVVVPVMAMKIAFPHDTEIPMLAVPVTQMPRPAVNKVSPASPPAATKVAAPTSHTSPSSSAATRALIPTTSPYVPGFRPTMLSERRWAKREYDTADELSDATEPEQALHSKVAAASNLQAAEYRHRTAWRLKERLQRLSVRTAVHRLEIAQEVQLVDEVIREASDMVQELTPVTQLNPHRFNAQLGGLMYLEESSILSHPAVQAAIHKERQRKTQ